MHEFEKKELKQIFPSSEGWKPGTVVAAGISGSMYSFVRDLWVGKEVVNVACMYDPVISLEAVTCFSKHCQNGDDRVKSRVALMVPTGSDISKVPEGIRVTFMSSFGYDGEKLVWLNKKKNARKYSSAQPVMVQPPLEQPAQTIVS